MLAQDWVFRNPGRFYRRARTWFLLQVFFSSGRLSHQRPLWLLTKRKRMVLFTVGLPALSFRSIKHGMEPCSFAHAMLFCINRGHPSEMSQAGSQWRLYNQFTIGIRCETRAENALTDLEHANTRYTWLGSPVKPLRWGTEEQEIHKSGGRNGGKQAGPLFTF